MARGIPLRRSLAFVVLTAALAACGKPPPTARTVPAPRVPLRPDGVLRAGTGSEPVVLRIGDRSGRLRPAGDGAVRMPTAAQLRARWRWDGGSTPVRVCTAGNCGPATLSPDTPLRTQKGIFEDVQYLSPPALAQRLDAYRRLDVRWVRFQLLWSTVQPDGPGEYRWGIYDRVIEAIVSRGMKPLPVLGTSPAWARPAGCVEETCAPARPAEFARFAGRAARRYDRRGVHDWEIWNEPNLRLFFKPNASTAAYARLLIPTSAALHRADPGATVITGGLASVGNVDDSEGHKRIGPISFLKGIYENGAGDAFDAVGHHPYTWPDRPSQSASDSGWNKMANTVPSLRSVMIDHGDAGKRIWVTEYGSHTATKDPRGVDEAEQAEILADGWRLWQHFAWAGPMIVYSYEDLGSDPRRLDQAFGLVRSNGRPKVAYRTFRRLAEPQVRLP